MNRYCYRLIFNRARGLLVAVAEIAYGLSPAAGDRRTTRRSMRVTSPRSPSKPASAIILSLSAGLLPVTALAQIIADKAAPASQQPVLMTAPNGVPLVNIQTPSPAGVSKNAYSQFDVPHSGAILNNGNRDSLTQLGGWVTANPLLTHPARVIVNEVNSSDPSLLRGYVEVAGQGAQVVIANPSGITCNGCGFINATQNTLTTGMPRYEGDKLAGYRVSTGTIRIDGAGLDAGTTDYTAVIARAVKIHAALRSKNLSVIAGSNDINAASLHATPVAGTNAAPELAIDTSNLGGMYAGKIWLVSTEAGVGVRHAGYLGGGADTIHISAAGRLEISGTVHSDSALAIRAMAGMENRGLIHSQDKATLEVMGELDNRSGTILSYGDLAIAAADPGKRSLRITNTGGKIGARSLMDVNAFRLSGDGNVISHGELRLNLLDDYDHTGMLAAAGKLSLTTSGTVNNHAVISAGNDLSMTAARINNEASGKLQAPALTLTATADHALVNRGLVDGRDVLLRSFTIKNLGTGRIYGDRVALDAGVVVNDADGGQAPVIAARQRLDIASDQVSNRHDALLYSGGDLAIGRTLDANGHASGTASSLENTGATIEASGNMSLAAIVVNNSNARFTTRTETSAPETIVEASGSGSDRRYTIGSADVQVYDDESLHLRTPEGNYEQWVLYKYQRTVTETMTDSSAPAQIIAGRDIRFHGQQLTNDKGRIIAGGDIKIDAGTVNNIDATGTRTIVDQGIAGSYWRHFRKGRDRTGYQEASYAPPPEVTTISMGVTEYRNHATHVTGSSAKLQDRPANGSTDTIRTVDQSIRVPASSLYRTAPAAMGYLVETDSRFTNYRQWLSSDYLLNQLSHDPQYTLKRLGDGFYEQKLMREQVAHLTGRRFLQGHASDEAQYQALMDSALTQATALQLVPGIALSAAQMAALTSDLVWMVEKEITLPDGQVTHALVPQVYLRVRDGDLQPDGTLIAGERVGMRLSADLRNAAQISGGQALAIDAANILNIGGTLAGERVMLSAERDLTVSGGRIEAGQAMQLHAGNDITVESTTRSQSDRQGNRTHIDRVGSLAVSSGDGQLVAVAGHDLTLKGASVQQGTSETGAAAPNERSSGAGHSAGSGTRSVILVAGNDLRLDTVTERRSESLRWDAHNHRSEASRTEQASEINANGAVVLAASRDVAARGAQINSATGGIGVYAGRDVKLDTAQSESRVDESHRHTSRGTFSSKTVSTRDTLESTTHQGTLLSGDSVTIDAGRDIDISASGLASTHGTRVEAGRDVTIAATTNTRHETHLRQEKKSGLMGSGGLGFTVGTRRLTTNSDTQTTTASASTIGATDGDVTVKAGNAVVQTGSHVLAPQGDVRVEGRRVDIREARNTETTTSDVTFKQSGVTVAISNPVVAAVQATQQMSKSASQTSNPRMKALAAANATMAVANAADAVSAGQGSTINGMDNQIATGRDASGNVSSREANAADKFGGIQLAVSIGTAKSSSHSVTTRDEAAPSTVAAGGKVSISAKGNAATSDVTLRGSKLHADRSVSVDADHDVRLQAAASTRTLRETNSSSSASLGLILDSRGGVGVNLSGSRGKGHAEGKEVSHTQASVSAGKRAAIRSGADLHLQGATITAPHVSADVAGKLVIESLQDSSSLRSEQKQIGSSLTIGTLPSANLSIANDGIDSSYRSVNRQSGIRAGDGGFKVNVAGDALMTGGVITSTQTATDAGRNQFSIHGKLDTADIDNHARYDASATSVSLGAGFSPLGKLAPFGTGVGLGKDGGSATSVTRSGISGIAGDTSARTGDKEPGLEKIFDPNRAREEIRAQAEITQMFGTLAPKAVANHADKKVDELQRQQQATTDPAQRQELQQQIDGWKDGGNQRVALHAAVGAAAGGVPGAAGAATSATITPQIAASLDNANLPDPLKTGVIAAAGTLAGAAIGGAPGAAAALSETSNNFLSHAEARQREQATQRLIACKDSACKQEAKREIDRLNALDRWRDEQIAAACVSPASALCKAWYGAVAEVRQSYKQGYSAREDVTLSVANERRQVNEMASMYRRQIEHPMLVGMSKGLMKLTPPGVLIGVGVGSYQLTQSIIESGLIDTATAIAQGIADIPSDLKARLNSTDPTVRGEALVDTFAVAGMSAVFVAKLEQAGANAVSKALQRQAAIAKEIELIEKNKIDLNSRRDDSDVYFEFKKPSGEWRWPENDGAITGTERFVTLPKGFAIDRYGDEWGYFVAPLGAAIESRSLAPGVASSPYRKYEVVRPIPEINQSTTAPAFGKNGNGTQFRLPKPISWYLENGYIKEIK